MCHNVAIEAGVKHGRLPLDKFLQMKARKVLTIDHGKCCQLLNFFKAIVIRSYEHFQSLIILQTSEIKYALIFLSE